MDVPENILWKRCSQLVVIFVVDGIEPLLKLASRKDSAEMLEVVGLACANLTASNPNNCR